MVESEVPGYNKQSPWNVRTDKIKHSGMLYISYPIVFLNLYYYCYQHLVDYITMYIKHVSVYKFLSPSGTGLLWTLRLTKIRFPISIISPFVFPVVHLLLVKTGQPQILEPVTWILDHKMFYISSLLVIQHISHLTINWVYQFFETL